MTKIKAGILGATGMVGQRFIELLENHPWFELTDLIASREESGKSYGEVMQGKWVQEKEIPKQAASMIVKHSDELVSCQVLFSSIPADIAFKLELDYARKGIAVISNASAHRMSKNVPLLVPEVNAEQLDWIELQKKENQSQGFIVTNPNCSTVPLTIILRALEQFEPIQLMVTTMQAVSGAGYPGVPSLDVLDNIVPYIGGEEQKIESETIKITGMKNLKVSASCNRVNVKDGHLESISIKFKNKPSQEQLIQALQNFEAEPQKLNLPTAPKPCIVVRTEQNRPQPRLDRMNGNGMAITVGRIRPCPILDYKMTILGHNTIRGAAGAAVLNAELLYVKGFFEKK
ncbi:MAG: aspartate-semialdehyde dehydrogenase [Candidatus Diapherotrites archaeon]|nr:aspartate-semialdehyde dehydrogenase [Candidatus Diapherotrites archaeon]